MPTMDPKQYMERGNTRAGAGDLKQAIFEFAMAEGLATEPRQIIDARAAKAAVKLRIALATHDFSEAIADLELLKQDFPADDTAYINLNGAYLLSGQGELLEPMLTAGIKAVPDNGNLKLLLGTHLRKVGRREEAVTLLEETVASFQARQSPMTLVIIDQYIGTVLAINNESCSRDITERDKRACFQLAALGLRISPSNFNMLDKFATMAENTGNYEAAVVAGLEIVKIPPETIKDGLKCGLAYLRLARSFLCTGDTERCFAVLELLEKTDIRHADRFSYVSFLTNVKAGNLDAAEQHLDQLRNFDWGNARSPGEQFMAAQYKQQVAIWNGVLSQLKGEAEEAHHAFRECLDEAPRLTDEERRVLKRLLEKPKPGQRTELNLTEHDLRGLLSLEKSLTEVLVEHRWV